MKYLTPIIKEYYMKDFNENVLMCDDKYWGLDKGLRDILININKNKNVQTIYSMRFYDGKLIDPMDECGIDSALTFIISEIVFSKLAHTVFPLLDNTFNGLMIRSRDPYFQRKRRPSDPPVNPPPNESALKMGASSDENYFNNATMFTIVLSSHNIKKHDKFWECLDRYLSNL